MYNEDPLWHNESKSVLRVVLPDLLRVRDERSRRLGLSLELHLVRVRVRARVRVRTRARARVRICRVTV